MKKSNLQCLVSMLIWSVMLSLSAQAQSTSSDRKTLQSMKDITTSMDNAALEWNKGNLNGYMALYDPAATMMMNDKRIGLDSMRKIYVKYYFTGNLPKQQLSYDNYQLTMLGSDYALLTGIFILKANDKLPEKKGRFSVILVHKHNHWLLLHDHSG